MSSGLPSEIGIWDLCGETRRTLGRLLLLDSSEEPAGAERLRFDVDVESVLSPEASNERL